MSQPSAEAEATLFRLFLAYGLDQDALQDLNSFSELLQEFLQAILYDGLAGGLDLSRSQQKEVEAQAERLLASLSA